MGKLAILYGLAMLAGFYPLVRAWVSARDWTIRHPLAWAFAAWSMWSLTAFVEGPFLHWLSLCLTACAGVAVLNARRPHAVAWHFVVAGLLVLLLRPVWETFLVPRFSGLYVAALGVALGVGIANYVPTRLGIVALLLGGWCGLDLARMTDALALEWVYAWPVLIALPWLGWLLVARRQPTPFDAVWLTFRDRYGFLWAALVREMFENAARNANWSGGLNWSGSEIDGVDEEKALAMLRAVLQRFVRGKDEGSG